MCGHAGGQFTSGHFRPGEREDEMMANTRTMLAAVIVGGACLALMMGIGAKAAAQGQASCSNQWLRGAYAFTIDGSILSGPAPVLVRGVAMTHFDGTGHLTQMDFVAANGTPLAADWRPATGSYQVNPDCTGSAEIFPVDGSPALRLRLVVFDRGNQVRTVVVGNAAGSHGVRVQ